MVLITCGSSNKRIDGLFQSDKFLPPSPKTVCIFLEKEFIKFDKFYLSNAIFNLFLITLVFSSLLKNKIFFYYYLLIC